MLVATTNDHRLGEPVRLITTSLRGQQNLSQILDSRNQTAMDLAGATGDPQTVHPPNSPRNSDIYNELPEGVNNYSETNQWQRSRVNLPQVTLDELTLHPLRLDVTVKGLGPLSFSPSESHLKQVCWSYD